MDLMDFVMEARENCRIGISELLCVLRIKEHECRFGDSKFQELEVRMENLSEKGACIYVEKGGEALSVMNVGDRAEFIFKLGKRYMTIGSEVKWVSSNRVGLYFDAISPTDADYISTLIKAYNIQL